ncbi:MAG: VWA domain-containing protein [Bifidobacteriaceae bacterium]|jgi:uncharacterized protein YegL|nr:VWA domain-containing protein [Bifidobacteriaceae bacterium]
MLPIEQVLEHPDSDCLIEYRTQEETMGGELPTASPDDAIRAMPFYIVVDRSGSMAGAPIIGANTIIPAICQCLAADPTAADCAHLGMISFNTTARVDLPLTSLSDLIDNEAGSDLRPALVAGGGTTFRAPIEALIDQIPQDVDRLKARGFEVYRPAVFFITDGGDNGGDFEVPFGRLTRLKYYPQIVPFGFGAVSQPELDLLVWPKVATEAYTPRWYQGSGNDTGAIIAAIIRGLSMSIMRTSRSVSGAGLWVNPAPRTDELGHGSAVMAHDASPFPEGARL